MAFRVSTATAPRTCRNRGFAFGLRDPIDAMVALAYRLARRLGARRGVAVGSRIVFDPAGASAGPRDSARLLPHASVWMVALPLTAVNSVAKLAAVGQRRGMPLGLSERLCRGTP
jgi:hypothetical protein